MSASQSAPVIPSTTEVLVVGYGPVGATMACLLGGYGVRAVVIDKARDILMMPRAIGMDQDAQRTLQMAGLADDAFAKRALPVIRMFSPYVGQFASFHVSGVVDGHAQMATFYQPELEQALRKEAARYENIVCATGVELLGFRQTEAGVRAQLKSDEASSVEITARYLIGADGANSMVRSAIGQDFRGQSYAEDWLIVDAKNVPNRSDEAVFYCQPDGASPHIPAPGNRDRWEFKLNPGETPEQMERDEEIKKLLAPWGDPAGMEIERKAVYRFHARCCDSFRKSRVFLAGDAAHIMPPFAGQGLVSGLRDAGNLCWKLAWVLRGHVSPDLLDSYDTERRPHAKAMIGLAKFLGHLVRPRNKLRAILVHGFMRFVRMSPLRRFIQGTKIKPKHRYRDGFFIPGGERLTRGALLPQGFVRSPNGEIVLSDEALGDHLALVGFGTDPRCHLADEEIAAWLELGGKIVQIVMRAQDRSDSAQAYEDLTGLLIPKAAPFGWAAVVRPDRIVLHDGPVSDSSRLIREARLLLAQPHRKELRA